MIARRPFAHALACMLGGSCGALERMYDPVDSRCDDVAAGCEPAIAEAIDDLAARMDRLGVQTGWWSPTEGEAILVDAEGVVVQSDDGALVRFGWPEAPPPGVEVGDRIALEFRGEWQILRADDVTLAVLLVESSEPAARYELPDAWAFTYEPACELGDGTAMALRAGENGLGWLLEPGASITLGAWTLTHRGAVLVRDWPDWDPDAEEPPEAPDRTCSTRRALGTPIAFRAAVTAVWERALAGVVCEDGVIDAASSAIEELYDLGISLRDGREHTAYGTVRSRGSRQIEIDLPGGESAIFRWHEAIPEEFEVGTGVTLVRRSGWDELHGPWRLAARVDRDWVYSTLDPSVFDVALAYATLCEFYEPDGDCGPPRQNAAVVGLVLPDGELLGTGERRRFGDVELVLHGALQLPGSQRDWCGEEPSFRAVVTAQAPAPTP